MSAAEKALAALEAELSDLRPRVWTDTAAKIVMPIAAPLAAVARAAMARPWWQRYAEGHRYFANCMSCGAEMKRAGDPWTHEVGCRFSEADRRLDALEAAAEGVTS